MKDMMQSLQFKPAGIKENVQNESKWHKLKIIGFAFLMAGVGTTYQAYFDGLVYRSGIYQKRALAGLQTFTEFRDGDNPTTLWQEKNELDVLEGRSFQQLKYMQTGDHVDEFKNQDWYWNGDFDDDASQRFFAAKPFRDEDPDSRNMGAGWTGQGSGEKWVDTTWKKAQKTVERNTDGKQELPASQTQTDTQYYGGFTWTTDDAYSNANGNIYNGQWYWTQTQRFDHQYAITQAENAAGAGLIQWRRDRYEDWEKMHSNILWFDTAACLDGGHIGNVNKVIISPATDRYARRPKNAENLCDSDEIADENVNCIKYVKQHDDGPKIWLNPQDKLDGKSADIEFKGWWKGTAYDTENPAKSEDANKDNPEVLDRIYNLASADEPRVDTYRPDSQTKQNPKGETGIEKDDWVTSWGTSIRVYGSMNWADEDLYRDFLKDWIDLFEDCDIDCQARGSQLTTIAGLMAAVYGLVTLNAVFMFIGTWRWWARVCSIWCTFGVCLFQFCALIAAGVMMFTKYNAICARSIQETMGDGNKWSMADDFYMTFSIWIVSFITMFCFVCCGLCSAIRDKN